jgi:hypothetical protein
MRHTVAAVQRVGDDIGDEPGVETGLLEGSFEALTLRAVIMQAVVVRDLASGGGRLRLRC